MHVLSVSGKYIGLDNYYCTIFVYKCSALCIIYFFRHQTPLPSPKKNKK